MVEPMDTSKDKKDGKDKKEVEEEEVELSEEDTQLKNNLEMLVERLQDKDASLHRPALESMRTQIRAATSSMTSVPKPLKFLRPHYAKFKEAYSGITSQEDKKFCADVISLLAMTIEDAERETLKYCLLGSKDALGSWGHEFVRHLQAEIAVEYNTRLEKNPPEPVDDLIDLAKEIVPYNMAHNSEAEACDLLMEIERMDLLIDHVQEDAADRVCLYLFSCVPYVPEPEDSILINTCLGIFRKFDKWPQAMQMCLKLNDIDMIKEVFLACPDKSMKRQLAFMLGRQQIMLDLEEVMEAENDDEEEEIEKLNSLISNTRLNQSFLDLARELDITEPKTPADIYKTHLEPTSRGERGNVEQAKENLAATFVNAFVNAGFGTDKLILGAEDNWVYKNKDQGRMSAAASMGMLLLWDVDGGLTQIDAYLLSEQDNIKAGALLAIGIVNSGVHNDCDPALALLTDYTCHEKNNIRVGANMGLGLAYAGSLREDVKELLLPALEDPKATIEARAVTALALGQIFVGSCDGDIAEAIITVIMTLTDEAKKDTHARFLALALGLVFLGKQQKAEVILATLQAIPGFFGKIACTLVDICAYAGTGNVLKVQEMLHICSEHITKTNDDGEEDPEKELDDVYQGFAVLGIALIAMGEDVGSDMALRSFNHLLQFGEPVIRRAVPVAMALLCTSNAKLHVLDILSKLSHDSDASVAYNSIFAMGLVGGGSNHARISGMLRHLAIYYSKDPNALFVVRIAQGLLHAGKGSVTFSPFHTDRTLMSTVAVSGLLAALVSVLDTKNVILGNSHYMLYHFALAMWPRILCTFDEELETIQTPVRVGQAVDVVGQAGKPKTITGFITNTTPVLLAHGERAGLASEEYKSLTPFLEGFVILTKEGKDKASAEK